MKMAMFGGTFNPMHKSHVYVLEEALKQLDLDKILVVPTYTPPHKIAPDLANATHRLEMARLSLIEQGRIEVCNYEIEQEGASYTYKTLEWIAQKYEPEELVLIMGSDMFLTLDEWKHPEVIYKLATICAISRSEEDVENICKYEQGLESRGIKVEILNSQIRPMSSTEIRRLIKENKPVDKYLEPQVIEYIKKHNLYR